MLNSLLGIAFGHGLVDVQIAEVSRELKNTPGDESLLLRRADLYRIHEEYEKARGDLDEILGRSTPSARAYFSLATLERDQKKFLAASKAMERYLLLVKDNPKAYREAAWYYFQLGKQVQSADSWSSYFKCQKDDRVSAIDVRDFAEALLKVDKNEEARALLNEWGKRFPYSIEMKQMSAKCFLADKRFNEAADEFEKLRERYPALVPRLSLREGQLYQEFGKVAEAKESWHCGLSALDKMTGRPGRSAGIEELRIEILELLK